MFRIAKESTIHVKTIQVWFLCVTSVNLVGIMRDSWNLILRLLTDEIADDYSW